MTFLLKILYTKKITSFIVVGLIFAIVISTYMALAINTVRGEYKIEELKAELTQAEKLSNQLRVNLATTSSLELILETSNNFEYEEIHKVTYLKKSSSSPFAQAQ